MFGIGFNELILILIVALVVFGPGKLPEVGRAVGKGLREFKKVTNDLSNSINESTSDNKSTITSVTKNDTSNNNSDKEAENKVYQEDKKPVENKSTADNK